MGVKRGDMSFSETDVGISEDEAALYDRQIRLWGLESQKRLREAKILVVNIGGLGAEICKNVALAGVKSITLLDNKIVNENDLSAQFLIDANAAVGKNRAEASVDGIRQLNPNVLVACDIEDVNKKNDDYFCQFDIICATHCDLIILQKLNKICREHSIKFFWGDTFGFYGHCFLDLGHYNYLDEISKPVNKGLMEDEIEPSSKRSKVMEKELIEKKIEYVSLEKALSAKFGKLGTGLHKRTSVVFFLVHILLKFCEKHQRLPSSKNLNEDLEVLKAIRQSVMEEIGFDCSKVGDELLCSACEGELSPVCAVVGGVLSQEIIKAVSRKEEPIQNFFFFNGENCLGVTENIGR